MKRPPTNVAASVKQRLLNLAVKTRRPFNSVLMQYFQERLVARLAASAHAGRFLLKGSLVIFATAAEPVRLATRPTKDIDLQGRKVASSLPRLAAIFRDMAAIAIPDGVVFDPKSVEAERIREDSEYGGVRVTLQGRLGSARGAMQVDVGFGDVVTPKPSRSSYPVLLDATRPELWMVPVATTLAEKFETMVKRERLNSRMKDFFDLWYLAREREFDGRVLKDAVRRTFEHRKTSMNPEPPVFARSFARDEGMQRQWKAFVRRANAADAPAEFETVMELIARFLEPLFEACRRKEAFDRMWRPGEGAWRG